MHRHTKACTRTGDSGDHLTHRTEARREARESKGLTIAIATLISANDQDPCKGIGQGRPYGCGLLPWCVSAHRLQSALAPMFRSVDVVALHGSRLPNASQQLPHGERRAGVGYEGSARKDCWFNMDTERLDLADCPGVQIITPRARMLQASLAHAERVIASKVMSYYPDYIRRGYVFLWKWEYWRLKYDAVLHADLDVDLLPSPRLSHRIAAEWAERLPPLVSLARNGSLSMLGYTDVTTPYNGGMFWAFPPRDHGALYREGLDVLGAPWDPHLGWERAGAPRSLFPRGNARHADGELVAKHPSHLGSESWSQIDSGDLDQGLLLYMMQHRHRAGAYMRGDSVHRAAHYVMNKFKPWMRALNYIPVKPGSACSVENLVRQSYMSALGVDQGQTQSACGFAFRAAAAELDVHLNRTACCASLNNPPVGSAGGSISMGRPANGFGSVPVYVF